MNLQFLSLLLCCNCTLQMPHCVIAVLLYVFNSMLSFLIVANCSFAALGNNFLYMCKGIMFQALPVSPLYDTIIEASFDNVFGFAVITKCLFLK